MKHADLPRSCEPTNASSSPCPDLRSMRIISPTKNRVVSELLALARLPADDRESIRRERAALAGPPRGRREGKTGIESLPPAIRPVEARRKASCSCASRRRCCAFPTPTRPTDSSPTRSRSASGRTHLGEADFAFRQHLDLGPDANGKLVRDSDVAAARPRPRSCAGFAARVGEPVVRTAFRHAMRIMGRQFVMGRTIDEALERAASDEQRADIATPTTCWGNRR